MSSEAARPPEFSQLLREIDSVVSTSEQRHRSELQTLRQQVVDAGSQVSSLDRRLQTQTQQNSILQSEISQLQRQLRQYAGVSEQLDDLRQQSEQLRQTHEQSKSKHKRHMQRAKDRQSQLEAENATKLTELETARQNLQTARMHISASAADQRSCKEELAAVRQRSNSLAEKCSLLRQQVEQSESERTVLQCQVQEHSKKYQAHITELEAKVHTLRMTSTSNLELTKSSLDKAQTQVNQLTEENLSLRRQLTKVSGDLELLNVNHACLKDELSAVREELQVAQNAEKRDASRQVELEHKLLQKDDVIRAFEEGQERVSSAAVGQLRHEVDNLRQRLQRSAASEKDLQSSVARLGERVDTSHRENDSLCNELATVRTECDHYRDLYQVIQSKETTAAAEERTEAQRARMEALQLQSRLSAREAEAHRWSEDIRNVEDQLRKMSAARDACQSQLKVANAQLDQLRQQNAALRAPSAASGSCRLAPETQHQSPDRTTAHGCAANTHFVPTSEQLDDQTRMAISTAPSAVTRISGSVPAGPLPTLSQALPEPSVSHGHGSMPVGGRHDVMSAIMPSHSDSLEQQQHRPVGSVLGDLQLLTASHSSSISKLSDIGSVSSLTTSDSDGGGGGGGGDSVAHHGVPAASRMLAPGNSRQAMSPSAGSSALNESSDTARYDATSSFTPSTAQLMECSSTMDDTSRLEHNGDTTLASRGGSVSASGISEAFVEGFLNDHMSVLQARIEETMHKLGLASQDA